MATNDRIINPVQQNRYGSDWLDRQIIPDVYPRQQDPYLPPGEIPPTGTPSGAPIAGPPGQDLYQGAITQPGVRPVVYQRAVNVTVATGPTAVPILNGTVQCDAFIIDVPSSLTNSTFFGFGSGVTPNNGIEVQPGLPQFYSPTNIREQWELQRLLEAITAMLGYAIGMQDFGQPIPGPGTFMAPRTVLNANDYYLVNNPGITQNVNVMLFFVPEFQ